MCRYADYIELRFKIKRDTEFITPGHQELELALFRLYDATGEKRYYELAEFFINERGPHDKKLGPTASHAYNQSHLPVREQREAVGHAVRAAYIYAAMAELCKRDGDEALFEACEAIFENISKKKMYSHLAKENFTQSEIASMVKLLNLDVNQIMIIFFADKVS